MNDLTIYVCGHNGCDLSMVPNTNEYKILLNTDLPLDILTPLDLSYSEGHQMFYLYHQDNLPTYIGINHYHRFFSFLIDVPNMNTIFDTYDIILGTPMYFQMSTYEQWISGGRKKEIDLILSILYTLYPDYYDDIEYLKHTTEFYKCNMFIMKNTDFINYCKWLFPIFHIFDKMMHFYCDADLEIRYNTDRERLQGHAIERLFNIYIHHNFTNIKTYDIIVK